MTIVELKYNPYTNETHILVDGKMLPESEVKEYVGAEQEISAWAQNFWERIATKCNDDFTVRFCGLAGDYKTIAEEFRTYKESADVTVSLEPDYIVNPDRIHDEQHVKDELDIVFGKKSVEHPVLAECPDCKAQIPEGSTYCPACGKKQDGTARIDESRQYVEQYLAGTEAGEETKERFRALYELLQPLYAEGEAVQLDKSRQQAVDLSAFEIYHNGRELILKDVTIGGHEQTQLVIPDCFFTKIEREAFSYCRNLESMVIPSSITEIEYGAFSNCSSLKSVVIPDSITKIEFNTFMNCSSLESVVIPDSVTEIGNRAFSNCSNLKSIEIPDSVMKIGDSVFKNCSSLKSVVIPNSITKIEFDTFMNCSSLESVVIPDSVTEIGGEAFYGCSSLKSVELPSSTKLGNAAFPEGTVIKTYNPLMKSAAKVVGSAAIIAAGLMAAPIAFAKAVSETAQTNDRK